MVGEIRDEFRQNNNDWTRLDDGSLIVKGSLPIFSLERILGIDIENEELDLEDEVSIGGLIMSHFGWLGSPEQPITLAKIAGVLVMIGGVTLATYAK